MKLRSSSRNAQDKKDEVNFQDYYGEWHGHKVKHLNKIYPKLRASSDKLIFTCGDSSLDNKYWYV